MLPLPSHIAAIQNFSFPSIIQVPGVNVCSLTDELPGGRKGLEKLEWSDAMVSTFAAAKQALLLATHLAHTMKGADLSLVVDALAAHLGVCVPPAAAAWQKGLAAPGIFLEEARDCKAELLCFQEGAVCLIFRHQAFLPHAGWLPFHDLH